MANLKIKFDGLKQFVKDVAEKQDGLGENELQQISNSILGFHSKLEQRVEELFNTPVTLTTALIGHSVKKEKITNTFARFGLQYRDIPTKLDAFPFTVTPSGSLSSAPLVFPDQKYVLWKQGAYSSEISVEVRKGKPQTVYAGQKIFIRKDKGGLRARKQDATWNVLPTGQSLKSGTTFHPGERDNTTTGVFGPSPADMASGVLKNDTYINEELNNLSDEIFNIYAKFYFNFK